MAYVPKKKQRKENYEFEDGILTPADRPKTRADCANIPRPCPFVSCRHHLYLDVLDNGYLKIRFPDTELSDMAATCSLDLAEAGGLDLEQVGEYLNLTRERIRQILEEGLGKIRANVDQEVVKILFSFQE